MMMDKSKGFQEVRERFASMKQERRNIMKRIGKGILALMITLTTLFSGIHIEPVFAAAPAGEYPISEDAFVRSDRGTTVYNHACYEAEASHSGGNCGKSL